MDTMEKETSLKPRMASLGAYVAKKPKSLDPRKFPNEEFELFSVPSHADGKPEVVEGKTIGASKQMVEDDTVLLCKINPRINRTWVVSSHTGHRKIASSEWITFPPHPDFLPKYVGYYLRQDELREYLSLNASGVGGSLMRAKPSLIKDYPFPLFPLPQQRRIVSAIELQLGRLDAAVARLQAAKAKLKRYKQAVLKAAYDDSLAETDGVTSSLDEICTKITDGEHLRPKTVSDGVPFLSAKDIRDDDVSFADPLFVPESDAAKYRKRCDPVRGDILIVSRGATVGRMCIVRTDEVFCLLGSVILLKVQAGVDSQYVSWMIKSPDIKQQLTSLSGSTAQQAIYLKDIRKVELPLPSPGMQTRLALEIRERYSAIDEMEATLDAQLLQSTRLRQAVLKRAFEGRLVEDSVERNVSKR